MSMVTFKIGDLMRGRIKSAEKKIISVYSKLKQIDEYCPNILKIIRLKDKLDDKDKNLLLNFQFNTKIQCELQL